MPLISSIIVDIREFGSIAQKRPLSKRNLRVLFRLPLVGQVMKSNAELVQAAKLGDTPAFGELVRRFERAVWATAWRIVGDYHASQDVTQETFVLAHQRIGELRRADAIGAWLLCIAEREAFRVAKTLREFTTLPNYELLDSGAHGELSHEHAELIAAIGRLPEHERLVTVLHYLDGRSVAEVAELTARPVGTVTKQLSRAVQRLKYQLQSVLRG